MARWNQDDIKNLYSKIDGFIDERTMDLHYNVLHKKYVDGLAKLESDLNKSIPLHVYLSKIYSTEFSLEVEKKELLIKNGGGHYNHTIFFQTLTDKKIDFKEGNLKNDIIKNFGSFDEFVDVFVRKGSSVFGSGWCWLVRVTGNVKFSCFEDSYYKNLTLNIDRPTKLIECSPGDLIIVCTDKQESPIMYSDDLKICMGCDLFEHSYLNVFNANKVEYIYKWFKHLDWSLLERIYTELVLVNKPLGITETGKISLP
ncbi:SODM1 [Hepatospora eriocheir]|uniref:Superoxide dismutase n=1 Tax=Hepatospora eriocheir TaxID=1081669 RepID=A0A1X0Q8E8_9MICR|nr:SODM1 [Hepatospora eriocheir]